MAGQPHLSEHRHVLPSSPVEAARHPLAERPLEFKELTLCQRDYREFVCSRQTFDWLVGGAMTHLDGIPVRLQLMDTLVGGHNVIAKIWGVTPADEAALDIASPRHLKAAA